MAVKAYLTGLPLDPFADLRGGGGYNTTIVNPGYRTPCYSFYCRGRRAMQQLGAAVELDQGGGGEVARAAIFPLL